MRGGMSSEQENIASAAYGLGQTLDADGLDGLRDLFEDAIETGTSAVPVETAVFMRTHRIRSAFDAYAVAAATRSPAWRPPALVAMAMLIYDENRVEAMRLLVEAIESEHEEATPLALLLLAQELESLGAIASARDMYVGAINSQHPTIAPEAGLRVGYLLIDTDPATAAQAFEVAELLGDPATSARASLGLGLVLERFDAEEARMAFEEAAELDDEDVAPLARLMLGWLLLPRDRGRAIHSFEQAARASGSPLAARAAYDLGVLLGPGDGDRWLARAIAGGEASDVDRARVFLAIFENARQHPGPDAEAEVQRALRAYEAEIPRWTEEMRAMFTQGDDESA
jgi:hypothetical protein